MSRVSKAFTWMKWSMRKVKREPACGREPSKECQNMNGVRRDSHREQSQAQDIRIQAGEKGICMGEQAT